MHFNLDKVQNFALFNDLSPEELDEIYPLLHPMRVLEGEQLIREGDTAHTFFIIISGNYMVHFKNGRAFTLHQEGDIIGWSTAINPFRYTTSATALTRGEVVMLHREEFLQLMQSHPPLVKKLIKKIDEIAQQQLAFTQAAKSSPLQREDVK